MIGQSGWNGSIAVATGNRIYLATPDGQLVFADYSGRELSPQTVIGQADWNGKISILADVIYLASTDGQLRRGLLNENKVFTEEVGQFGWNGSIALAYDRSRIYLASADGQLLRGTWGRPDRVLQ